MFSVLYDEAIYFPRRTGYGILLLVLFCPLVQCTEAHLTFDEHLNEGRTERELGNFTDAGKAFDKAIDLHPDSALAFYERGHLRMEKGRYANAQNDSLGKVRANSSAVEDFDKARELEPYNLSIFFYRGMSKAFLKDFVGAIMDYDTAIELHPGYADAYNERGFYKFYLQISRGLVLMFIRLSN